MRFLVPMDGSDNALRALEYVIGLQQSLREPLELHLLNVQRAVASGNVRSFISHEQLQGYYQDEGAAALEAARARLSVAGVEHKAQVAVGEESGCICQYANENHVQMIVMGTRGMGTMANLLLGSVASKVIHASTIPVLLIK